MFRLLLVFVSVMSLQSQTGYGKYQWWAWTPGDAVDDSSLSMFSPGYHPDQPLPFDHSLHAGKMKIDCEYCHSAARRSISAGIPPMNTCMGCHRFAATDKPAIKQLTKMYENNQAIEWTKVHDLPDFVRFSHEVHVHAKGPDGKDLINCQTCHGPVETMTTAEQVAPLQMGWCLECHNQEWPDDGSGRKTYAPVSCNTCHY
ncbi:MAG: cytochrome c3 family protein [Oligoflexales bacterium]